MRIMNKNQIKAIAAAVGYFVLYACSMLLFQSVFTIGLMGQKFALGIRNEAAFVDSANNNFLLTMLLAVASVGLTFYLIFRLRGKDVRREWRINPFASRSLLLSVLVAVAYSAAYSWLSNVDGRKIEFKVSAYCGETLFGEGTHLRFIVDRERFMSKIG